MVWHFIEATVGGVQKTWWTDVVNGNIVDYSPTHTGSVSTHPKASGISLSSGTSLADHNAANAIMNMGWNSTYTDFWHYTVVPDQELKIMFYPNGNVQDADTDQELKIMFYPNGNVQNAGTVNQELKIQFYPTNRVQDVGTGITWKWWLGMRGKKRYGNKAIRRLKI